MWPLDSTKPVAEYDASDEIDELYHDIRQTLRVTGVNLIVRALAGYHNALPTIWQALSPVVSTRAFEQAADRVRARAVESTAVMERLGVPDSVRLGPSQSYQIQKALALYHYINPKLLVMISALRSVIEEEHTSPSGEQGHALSVDPLPRGEPNEMYPMEMVSDKPDEEQIAMVFEGIIERYSLSSINSDYRTLALWPEYLAAAWGRLQPLSESPAYRCTVDVLQEEARAQALSLPVVVGLSPTEFEERISDAAAVKEKIADFERVLPPLILNIAMLSLDWQPAEALRQSPFAIGAS